MALAVQFQPLAIDTIAAAAYYSEIRADFPRREEQLARPPIVEEFTSGPALPFQFQIVQAPAFPRLWFLSESGTRLVQLQNDLVAYNWRRRPDGQPVDEDYPRYDRLRSELEKHLALLANVVDGGLRPNWCEVTYIDQISPMPGSDNRPRLGEFLNGIEVPAAEGFLPTPEDGGLGLRFIIPGAQGPRGRLTINLASGERITDGVPVWVMTMTARVRADEETVGAALNALDIGHEWISRGFLELTSDAIQEHWGKEET